jgi:SAM-dependent methyltransferase
MATPNLTPGSKDASIEPRRDAVQLPALTNRPTSYSGCCLALSTPLIQHLHSLLPPVPALVLSVGSGFGLLEAHLLAASSPSRGPVHVIGVEVEPSPNHYLLASNHRVVHGTRFLDPLAAEATTWVFVYPRRVGLVNEYMSTYGQGQVEHIIWIGPRADWDEYTGCFVGWGVQLQCANEVGGRAYDMIAVAQKYEAVLATLESHTGLL